MMDTHDFSVSGVLEKGTKYSTTINGPVQIAQEDIPGVMWTDSNDEYDTFRLADGSTIYVPYSEKEAAEKYDSAT